MNTQDVKKLVETLKKEDRHEYKFHKQIMRPWGVVTTIMENTNYIIFYCLKVNEDQNTIIYLKI